ncbi:uncharacterized protein LAJ45_04840 [Morchella importuna]|uniref:uncharacterized protein n=1 Tax=Morchella importuna TaxID=1174673 RepID=UPI001E8D9AB3|nr:uncharacterized protein LAJ45_04840 [Morchella importuna]KAH8151138.1 hypothetical protein LAJ45_04840 [Morchella importuna]
MSGLLFPPTGAGDGGETSSSNIKPSENGAGSPPKPRKSSDRRMVFGTPTSQLSSTTDLPSQTKTDEIRPNAGAYLGMTPVRDSVGNLLQQQQHRGEGTRFSEDVQRYPPPGHESAQPDERDREGEGRTKHRWNSARSKLGNVLSVRHNIRDTLSSRSRQNSVMPKVDHLMNELNSREPLSRDNLNTSSHQGTGHHSPAPPHPTAATSLASTALPHAPETSSGSTAKHSSPSRFSSKLASWRHHHRKGRGRESLEEGHEGIEVTAAAEQLRSSSSPPTQRFRTRVNRFLRSGKHHASSTASPASSAAAAAGSEPRHPESLSTRTPAHTPPYLSSGQSSTAHGSSHGSGFREAMRRGVASARRRVSVPFLSVPLASNDVSDTGTIENEPPERPQTVPLERRNESNGAWISPGGSAFALNSKPGHDFLPSEATNVEPNYAAPPKVTENPAPHEWQERDFEQVPMIQCPPPLSPPGMEESPPISPWIKASDGTKEWLKLTPEETPFFLPEIDPIAPLSAGEMLNREYSMTPERSNGGQNLSDIYWAVGQGSSSNRLDEGQAIDKGKGKAVMSDTDRLEPPGNSRFYDTSGKSIEVLEEEKRRKSRDTGIMGLDPEVNHRSDAPSGSGSRVEDEDGEFTYASAVREIAGLDRYPKRPSHDDDANLDDVSVPECDYDFPLPSFRFSMLAEPSPSSNEPDASPCTASSSSTEQPSGSTPTFPCLASTHMQAATTTTTASTATTTRTTTASSTNPSASSSVSPPNISPCQYQMLLSSKRPYLFVLQELSSGTYVKITPQSSSSPVSRSMSTVSRSYPETPAASQTSPGPARSPVSVRFLNTNGLLACNADENDEDSDDEGVLSEGGGIKK